MAIRSAEEVLGVTDLVVDVYLKSGEEFTGKDFPQEMFDKSDRWVRFWDGAPGGKCLIIIPCSEIKMIVVKHDNC